MQKKSLINCLGFALAASLAFAGCGSGGNDVTISPGGGGTSNTGGGGGGTGGTGVVITGGVTTGGLGTGGATGVTNTGGGTATNTGGTATTDGGTATTTGGTTGGFLGDVTRTDLRTGLNRPTHGVPFTIGNTQRVLFVSGFGQTVGRLSTVNVNGTPTQSGFPLVDIQAANDSPLTNVLISPFDVVSDGNALYISVGFNVVNEGAIIRVSNFTESGGVIRARFEEITANVEFPTNPAYLTLLDNVGGVQGNNYIYWTEWVASGLGRVRRIRRDGTGVADIVVNNLNRPTGIDTDGINMLVCDSQGGAQGQVIRFPANPPLVSLPLNGADTNFVTVINPVNNADQAIFRPFAVKYDGRNGFFFTEGNSLDLTQRSGVSNGAVRFVPRTATTASIVSNGLTNVADIDAVDSNNDGTSAVLFSESVATNGRILRRLVNTASVTNAAPSVVDTGINNPLGVSIGNENQPFLAAVIDYIGSNVGIVRIYTP